MMADVIIRGAGDTYTVDFEHFRSLIGVKWIHCTPNLVNKFIHKVKPSVE